MSQIIRRDDYTDISQNDPDTDVTGAELEELTDGTETTLHSHAGGGGGASQLSDLSDVNTSTPTNRNVLAADGVDFESRALVEADISDLNHTVDVVSNVATSTVLGRTTAGSGDSEELTAAQVRTLINVEDGADVTDTTNVTAAGALMDSEVTNLAQVKAFDSSDYATAAQGATADSALQDVVDDTTPTLGGTLDANNNIISNVSTLGADFIDLNGNANSLILDADGDTIIDAAVDDTIDFQTGGVDRMSITNAGVSLQSGQTISSFGTLAEQNSVNNGDWSGTDLSVTNGGTGASTASAALSNLGGIGAATTDTLTNKTIDGDNNTLQDIGQDSMQATVAFRAYVGTNQASGAGSTVTVDYDTESYDYGSDFDTANNRFTAPYTGVYNFSAYVNQPDSGNPNVQIDLVVNGTVVATLYYMQIAVYRTAGGSTDLELTAGDNVTVKFTSDLADTIEAGSTLSYFTGHLIGRTD